MINEFFAYARERHAIHLRRAAGAPAPWTDDPVLQQYRFCNVFRELDATTVWFRENVRDPLRDKPEVLLATVVFRLFNRITTGEAIFSQPSVLSRKTAWEDFLALGDTDVLKHAILSYCDRGPYTTGSYMTKTPTGMNKLDGMLQVIEWFESQRHPANFGGSHNDALEWTGMADVCLSYPNDIRLEQVWSWLRQFPFIGDFTAYEIVTDLRHTALLDRAPDVNLWANPGPGCKKGLNRVFRGDPDKNVPREQWIEEMRELLRLSRDPKYWPSDWPTWELRTVEHTACEVQKYIRARDTGQGTRQRFRGGV